MRRWARAGLAIAAAGAAGFVCGVEGPGEACRAWCERQAECRGLDDAEVEPCKDWCVDLPDDCRDAYFECADRETCEEFVDCEDSVREPSIACAG